MKIIYLDDRSYTKMLIALNEAVSNYLDDDEDEKADELNDIIIEIEDSVESENEEDEE